MAKKKHKHKIRIKRKHISLGAIILLGVLLPFLAFWVPFFGKIYPGVTVAGIDLSGKTPEEAIRILSGFTPPSKIVLTISGSKTNPTIEIPTDSLSVKYDYNKTADAAYKFGRTGNPVFDAGEILSSIFKTKTIGLRFSIDEETLSKSISTVAGQIGNDPVYPSAKLTDGKVVIDKGKKGITLDANGLRILIGKNFSQVKSDPIEVPVMDIDPTLNSFELAAFEKRATTLSQKTLTLKFEDKALQYTGNDLLELTNPRGGYDNSKVEALVSEVASLVNRSPQEAKFVFDSSQKRVNTFQPSKDGVSIKNEELANLITEDLSKIENASDKEVAIDIPAVTTAPAVQTADVNNLGIDDLIGKGTSIFKGSIASRVYNVNLAASRISGTLVPPGETFSFNKAVGDISELTGYQKAYIIQNGKTILGDGGGVCQVSTTLFRAVLNAGLPITERTAHAYRVFYYEEDAPPGFDATVYSPTVDFKFRNDTPGYILVQAISDPKHYSLTFELYGTKDGRVAEVGKPVITSTTTPPPDVYEDDPSLPTGTVKQTEHKAIGTNLYMTYKVTKDGKIIFQKTFYSNYKPWANVFLKGTGV